MMLILSKQTVPATPKPALHKDHELIGRNDGGDIELHGWVDKALETEDEDLNHLFAGSKAQTTTKIRTGKNKKRGG